MSKSPATAIVRHSGIRGAIRANKRLTTRSDPAALRLSDRVKDPPGPRIGRGEARQSDSRRRRRPQLSKKSSARCLDFKRLRFVLLSA